MAQGPGHIHFDELDANSYYDSIQGLVSAGSPPQDIGYLFDGSAAHSTQDRLADIEEANQLFEASLIYNFKKEYDKAIDFLEKACKIYTGHKQFHGALRCLIELAWMKYSHDKNDGATKANRLFAEALKMINTYVQEPGINECRARLLHYQGLVKYRERKYGEALRLFMYAKTFCRPDSLEAARIQDSLAIHYERTNDYNRAIQCIQAALEIKNREGVSYEEAISYQILGRIFILKEEYAKAAQAMKNALEISEDLEDIKRIAQIKNDLVRLRIYQGDLHGAQLLLQEVITDCHSQGLEIPYGMALFYKAYLLFSNDEVEQCRSILEETVLPLFQKNDYKKGQGMGIRLLACVKNSQNNQIKAIEMMSEVISLFKEEGHVDELAKTYFELGKIYLSLNDKPLALHSMMEALKIAEANGLSFLSSYIEDEIFKLDEDKWQEIVDKRANNERIFEKQGNLQEALTSLTQEGGTELNAPSHSLLSLLRIAQAMAGEQDLDKLLLLITKETEEALNADRCSVFIYDKDTNELWSKVASGFDTTEEIRFPAHLGLAGYVAKTGEVLNIKDAYQDPRFNPEIDRKTGYKTDTILCLPIWNRRMEIMGVFQVLNKQNGHFEQADEDLLNAIASSAGVALENAAMALEMKISFESFVKTLSSTIDARDPITAGHSERVAAYSVLIGQQMNMVGSDIEALKYASLLHDIGKIGIREDVLKKDGRLTEKEYRHIQKHVFYTHEILKNVHFERHLRQVPEIAASHHEKVDGSGYHRGLKGTEIMLSGRILALSDVFDAITSRRHYRSRMPFDRVLSVIQKDTGSHFDRDCVESFLHVRLLDLGKILLMERAEEYDEGGLILLKKLDRQITVGEYYDILKKDGLSKGEADTHRIFSNLYHRHEVGDMD